MIDYEDATNNHDWYLKLVKIDNFAIHRSVQHHAQIS